MHPYASLCIRMYSHASVRHPYAPIIILFLHAPPLRIQTLILNTPFHRGRSKGTHMQKTQNYTCVLHHRTVLNPSHYSKSAPNRYQRHVSICFQMSIFMHLWCTCNFFARLDSHSFAKTQTAAVWQPGCAHHFSFIATLSSLLGLCSVRLSWGFV